LPEVNLELGMWNGLKKLGVWNVELGMARRGSELWTGERGGTCGTGLFCLFGSSGFFGVPVCQPDKPNKQDEPKQPKKLNKPNEPDKQRTITGPIIPLDYAAPRAQDATVTFQPRWLSHPSRLPVLPCATDSPVSAAPTPDVLVSTSSALIVSF
jgi:hypothetical protein